jgi:predicted permease
MKFHSSLLRIVLPRLLFTALARAKSKAKKPTLLLFLLAGGAAAVRGQSAASQAGAA